MQELLTKSKINEAALKRFIVKNSAVEISRLTEPCYYPAFKKYYFELLRFTGLTDKDVKQFIKRFYAGMPSAEYKLVNDPYSNLLIFIMYYFVKKRDMTTFKSTMLFYNLRMFSNLMHKHFPSHCNPEIFKYVLEHLVKNHLYAVHGTIGNAIYYLSIELSRKHLDHVKNTDAVGIVKFIQECRTRQAQSIRSFAEGYYKAQKEGIAYKSPYETDDEDDGGRYQETAKTTKVVTDTTKKITVYKVIDKKALLDAKNITKVSTTFATIIAKSLGDTKFTDNVRLVLELFLKDLNKVGNVCGNDYYKFLQSLMSIKRTNAKIYFKQQVEILLEKVISETDLKEKYEKQTNKTKHLNKLLLDYYITMMMRNLIC